MSKRQLVIWAKQRRLHGVGEKKAVLQRVCENRAEVEHRSANVRDLMVMDVNVTKPLASLPSTATDIGIFNLDLSLSCPFGGESWKTMFEQGSIALLPVCTQEVVLAHVERYDAGDCRLSAAKQLRDLTKHRILMDTLSLCVMDDPVKHVPVVFLRATVTASMASLAHKAAVILDLEAGTCNATLVRMALCNCKAGLSGMCGHIFALALLRDRPQTPLAAGSVTSRAMAWHRPTKGPQISNITPVQNVAFSPQGARSTAASVGSAERHNRSLALMPKDTGQLTLECMALWRTATQLWARSKGVTTAEMTRVADTHAIGTFTKKRVFSEVEGAEPAEEEDGTTMQE